MTALLTNLAHHWKLDETSGTSADSVGAVTLSQSGTVDSGTGKIGLGRDFSGGVSGDGLFASFNTNNSRSLSFWFKADTLSTSSGSHIPYGPLITNQGTNTQFVVDVYTTRLRFVLTKPANADVVLEYINSFTVGTWYFVVVTLDTSGNVMQLSVNGSTLGSIQTTFPFIYDENPGVSLVLGTANGFYGTTSGFDGIIDEVSLWDNRILTDDDVVNLYNGTNGRDLSLFGSTFINGRINSVSSLSASLSIFHPGVNLQSSYTKYLTTTINTELSWDLVDPDNGTLQEEVGDIQPEYELDTNVVDQAWYDSISISPTSSYNLDLTSLPISIFGMSVTRPFSNVNYLGIENTSPSSYLRIGSSGVTNSITTFGIISEVGYSGLSELISTQGFSVDSTHKNLTIRNPANIKITCKILILGTSG